MRREPPMAAPTADGALRDGPTTQVSHHVAQNVGRIAELHARAEEQLARHQRFIERIAGFFGRPVFFYVLVAFIDGWIVVNLLLQAYGRRAPDPWPFDGLQCIVGVVALSMANVILITQNRQGRRAEHRAHLDLQVSMLAEQKIAKLIALVEELRADLPNVRNRRDAEAEAMTEPADPAQVIEALKQKLPDET